MAEILLIFNIDNVTRCASVDYWCHWRL